METQAYVARLTPIVGGSAPDSAVPLASIVRSWTKSSLFVARSIGSLIGGRSAQKEQSQRSTNDRRLKDGRASFRSPTDCSWRCRSRAVAMSDHASEGYGRGLRVSEGRHLDPTHGRQDKSAAVPQAQMVGRVEVCRHPPRTAGWRFRHFSQDFHWSNRHPPAFPRATVPKTAGDDDPDLGRAIRRGDRGAKRPRVGDEVRLKEAKRHPEISARRSRIFRCGCYCHPSPTSAGCSVVRTIPVPDRAPFPADHRARLARSDRSRVRQELQRIASVSGRPPGYAGVGPSVMLSRQGR